MSLQFSHYHMIKMATKNSFYHLFYLLCAIQLPFQQRVLHLRSCMRGTHCDSKVLKSAISRQAKANKFSLVFWLNEIVPQKMLTNIGRFQRIFIVLQGFWRSFVPFIA